MRSEICVQIISQPEWSDRYIKMYANASTFLAYKRECVLCVEKKKEEVLFMLYSEIDR